jgi:hypothetical protein
MQSGSEADVRAGLQLMLDRLVPGRFLTTERKTLGRSMIGKPVDLEIRLNIGTRPRPLIAVEVANVNTTQLVGETCRLYYDICPLKLLVLGDRNISPNGQTQCEVLLARLYGQDDIEHTPARVVSYADDAAVERALSDLLLI